MTFTTRTDGNKKYAPGRLTPEKKQKALELRRNGWPGYEIARVLDVSPNAIYVFLRKPEAQPQS